MLRELAIAIAINPQKLHEINLHKTGLNKL